MSGNIPAGQELAPFYIAFRGEGRLINAYMTPSPHLIPHLLREGGSDLAEPILIGCISRAACDSTGGQDGRIFKQFRALIEAVMMVSCKESFGIEPSGFSEVSPPGLKGN